MYIVLDGEKMRSENLKCLLGKELKSLSNDITII